MNFWVPSRNYVTRGTWVARCKTSAETIIPITVNLWLLETLRHSDKFRNSYETAEIQPEIWENNRLIAGKKIFLKFFKHSHPCVRIYLSEKRIFCKEISNVFFGVGSKSESSKDILWLLAPQHKVDTLVFKMLWETCQLGLITDS